MFKKNSLSKAASLLIGVVILSLVIGYSILAWTEPSGAPPAGSMNAPINTGATAQTKTGNFTSNGDIAANRFCLGGDCCDSWSNCVALGGGCYAAGASCGADDECCSGICTGGTCVNPPSCLANGLACTANTDCCSASCTSGICTGGASCKDSMSACSSNEECCTGVCISGACSFYYPCSGKTLVAGAKKIFVTSVTYSAWDATNETAADAKCQAAANAVGYTGTFKALFYAGNRDINLVIPSGQSFWNGMKSGTDCSWVPIASNMADFFNADGSGNYLTNPILYNEQGVSSGGINVWTSFRPAGGGGYDNLNKNTRTNTICSVGASCGTSPTIWVCGTAYKGACMYQWGSWGGAGCYSSEHWYGNSASKTATWSYNIWTDNFKEYIATSFPLRWNTCFDSKRAFYCIEQ